MTSFTTKTGLVLPLADLKGKAYLLVAHRIQWWRTEHPLGRIDTECVESTDKYVIYKATISHPVGDTYVKLADAVKREDYAHFSDAHEKAQTSAIGRALAMVGYGTQFAPDLDEGDRLADSPVSRVPHQQSESRPSPAAAISAAMAISGNAAGSVICPVGRNKGLRIDQLSTSEILGDIAYWRQREKTDGKPLGGGLAAYVNAAEAHARANGLLKQQSQSALQSSDMPPSWVNEGPDSDIPF